jgi:hypothetical protein
MSLYIVYQRHECNLLFRRRFKPSWYEPLSDDQCVSRANWIRERLNRVNSNKGKCIRVSELVGDAKALHADSANAGAVFQVASQFNLLEMVSPSVTPEQGIGIYENDPRDSGRSIPIWVRCRNVNWMNCGRS